MRVEKALPPALSETPNTDVRAIRYKLKQSQVEFATMVGVSVSTLQGWEDGRHQPDGPAQALLRVAAKNPKMVAKALGRA